MTNKKEQLISAILWDRYFGIDFISGDANQVFDISETITIKENIEAKNNYHAERQMILSKGDYYGEMNLFNNKF